MRDGRRSICVVIYWIYVWLEGCETGSPEVSLVVAMTMLAVVFDGWLWEVDLLCLYPSWVVYFVILVCWPDTRTSVYESRGWYFSRCTAG